jgi:hypothetical protein
MAQSSITRASIRLSRASRYTRRGTPFAPAHRRCSFSRRRSVPERRCSRDSSPTANPLLVRELRSSPVPAPPGNRCLRYRRCDGASRFSGAAPVRGSPTSPTSRPGVPAGTLPRAAAGSRVDEWACATACASAERQLARPRWCSGVRGATRHIGRVADIAKKRCRHLPTVALVQ